MRKQRETLGESFSIRLQPEHVKRAEEIAAPFDQSISWAMREMMTERLKMDAAGLRVRESVAVDALVRLLKTPGFKQFLEALGKIEEDSGQKVLDDVIATIREKGMIG